MKQILSLVVGLLALVAGVAKIVTAFTHTEVACDSDTARGLVQQIAQDNIRHDPASAAAFSPERSVFTLSDIEQVSEAEGSVSCRATLTAQLDWSDALAGLKAQDPAAFEQQVAAQGLTGATDAPALSTVAYRVEEAQGDMIQVEVTDQKAQG